LISNHVLAISDKENNEFDRNPADVNVAMFVDILLGIGCVTVFISAAKIVEDEVKGTSSLWGAWWSGPSRKRHGRVRH